MGIVFIFFKQLEFKTGAAALDYLFLFLYDEKMVYLFQLPLFKSLFNFIFIDYFSFKLHAALQVV